MPEVPFNIVRCSWPRPIRQEGMRWTSAPEWDAPEMPHPPQPQWDRVGGERCWMIDWRNWFRSDLKFYGNGLGGRMMGFHIVFHVRVHGSGSLVIWDDDGSIIRRNGEIIHEDRDAHPPSRKVIQVEKDDQLEVAQWQYEGGWTWGAHLIEPPRIAPTLVEGARALAQRLPAVHRRLRNPNGPPLKMYFGDRTPVRSALSIYSMILNGYRPSKVLVFGDYQWSAAGREFFEEVLPFAEIVPHEVVLDALRPLKLAEKALASWSTMKTSVGLLFPPAEYCLMDDDVFILAPVDDALAAFRSHDLVFAPDADYSDAYLKTWGKAVGIQGPLATGTVNTGLYWARRRRDPAAIAAELHLVPLNALPVWQWEQGFAAVQFAGARVFELPTQRYFYPYFDGMPGGMIGYDYRRNPCEFASIHFGGLAEKPSDAEAFMLLPDILGPT